MYASIPVRCTYAQRKLINLVEQRGLRAWAAEHQVSHVTSYQWAVGGRYPSFKAILSLCDTIKPAEWIYYEDEKIPTYRGQLGGTGGISAAVIKLNKITQQKGSDRPDLSALNVLSTNYDIPVSVLRNIRYSLTNPSCEIIRKLREWVHPNSWFDFSK